MGNLGTLTLTIKQQGSNEVIAALKLIEARSLAAAQAQRRTITATNALSVSTKRLGQDLQNSFSNLNINNTNKSLIDLVQTMAILGKSNPFIGLGTAIKTAFNIRPLLTMTEQAMKLHNTVSKLNKEVDRGKKAASEKKEPIWLGTAVTEAVSNVFSNKLDDMYKSLSSEYAKFYSNIRDVFNNKVVKTIFPAEAFRSMSRMFTGEMSLKKNFASYMSSLIVETYKFAAAVQAVAIPAIIAIGTRASESAAKLESMQARFRAVKLGEFLTKVPGTPVASKQQIAEPLATTSARDMLDFVKQLAIPSTYTAQQLFESAQQMESFGLNTKKTLYLASQLAEVFGGTQEELLMITRMMGRMAAGELPDARALGRFGLNKEMLGITEGMSGEEMLTKFADTIRAKYSTIFEQLSKTYEAKLATFLEKYSYALATIGKPINDALIPILDNLSRFITQLEKAGVLDQIGKSIAELVKVFSEPRMIAVFQDMFFNVVAFIRMAAFESGKLMRQLAGVYYVGKYIVQLITAVKTFGFSMLAQKNIPSTLELVSGIQMIADPRNWQNLPGFFMANVGDEAQNMKRKTLGREYLSSFFGHPRPPGFGEDSLITEPAGKFINDMSKVAQDTETQTDTLKAISNNTKNISDELTLRQANLGGRGGPLATLGMSYADMIAINAQTRNTNNPSNGSALRQQSLIAPMSYLEMGIKRLAAPSFAFRRF